MFQTNTTKKWRAGNGTRTRDPQLGKLMLYQLSYSRKKVYFNYFAKDRQFLKNIPAGFTKFAPKPAQCPARSIFSFPTMLPMRKRQPTFSGN